MQVLSSPEASVEAASGSEFRPSLDSSADTPRKQRKERKSELDSEASLSQEEHSSRRRSKRTNVGSDSDFFLTAAQRKRKVAAASFNSRRLSLEHATHPQVVS